MRHHRRQGRHRRRQRRALRARGRDRGRRRPRRRLPRRPRAGVRRHRRGRGARPLRARARAVRPHRRALQQRGHLAQRRRVGARHELRGVAARAGRQPQVGLPVLQVRHRPPARQRARRVGHQHRVVRGGHGRRDLADLLHRQQGRRAGACRASWASSSPAAACASTRCARARSTRRCCASCSPRTPRRPRGAWSTCRSGRFARAEEIAAGALFLASDESSFVTATTFLVDGGLSGAYVTPE